MKFDLAIDAFIADWRREGRINSDRTEIAYRSRLRAHGQDVANRDPSKTGRDDVKRTLARWGHRNTQRGAHSVLISFYDWAMEEGIRKDNPARQVRRARKQPTTVYRLTRAEVVALMDTSMSSQRDRWLCHLGVLAGLRNQELRGLRGRHFERAGWVHVSADIAKGGRERWVPVLGELEPIVAEIRATVSRDRWVFPARRWVDPPRNSRWREIDAPSSPQVIWRAVTELAVRAGISAHVHPHLLRHAYGDHVAKHAGLRAAQALLGHASVDTTAGTYVDAPSLDELAISVHGFTYRGLPPGERPESAEKAPTGIEPVVPDSRPDTGDSR